MKVCRRSVIAVVVIVVRVVIVEVSRGIMKLTRNLLEEAAGLFECFHFVYLFVTDEFESLNRMDFFFFLLVSTKELKCKYLIPNGIVILLLFCAVHEILMRKTQILTIGQHRLEAWKVITFHLSIMRT